MVMSCRCCLEIRSPLQKYLEPYVGIQIQSTSNSDNLRCSSKGKVSKSRHTVVKHDRT